MLALIAIVVSLAAVFGLISARWLKLPTVVGTMVLTIALSGLLATSSHLVPSLDAWVIASIARIDFERFILHGLLSVLLFAGAFLLELEYLFCERVVVSVLATLGTGLSAGLVGLGMFAAAPVVGLHASLFECMLFGAVISPTDPIAVLEMLRRVAAPRYLQAQLAGESLFNDGVGAVLFLTALSIAESGKIPSVGHIGGQLLLQAGGGLLVGVFFAFPISKMMRTVNEYHIEILLTLMLALGGYALAEALHLSAPLEAVAAGLTLRWKNSQHPTDISHQEIEHFWTAIDEVQNAVLFVLMGVESLVVSFGLVSLEIGILAIMLVNLTRFFATGMILALVRMVKHDLRSSLLVIGWGGLRGGLSIALALSVPKHLGRKWILSATYTVVVFSIVIAGGSMDLFLRRFWRGVAQEA